MTGYERAEKQAYLMNRIHRCEQASQMVLEAHQEFGIENASYNVVYNDLEKLKTLYTTKLEELK